MLDTKSSEKARKEAAFIQNLHKIADLDNLITEINDHINQGLTDIAYLRFKNENLGYSLKAGSISETPAKRVLMESIKKNGELILQVNRENEWVLDEAKEDGDEGNEEKGGLLKENEMMGVEINEEIIMKFGITNRDPLVYHSQNEFIKALEKLIELKNFLHINGVFQ